MTTGKRIFDVSVALVLGVFFIVPMFFISALIIICDGRPVFYISERMKSPSLPFRIVKFRTMKVVVTDGGVSGADKNNRITRMGHFLRRTHFDEIPQIWNVLVGDMSFVGPRPPLRQYVDRFPEIYREVLEARPGITGLASVYFHDREGSILQKACTPEETDYLYSRYCVSRKAKIDLIYKKNGNLCMDIVILFQTLLGLGRR